MTYMPKYLKKCFTKEQKAKLLKTILELKRPEYIRDYIYLKLLFATGIRSASEGLTVTTQHLKLDQEPAVLNVPYSYSKTGQPKEIILTKEIAGLLKKFIEEFKLRFQTDHKGNTFIFYPYKKWSNRRTRVYYMSFVERWYLYRKEAGLDDIAHVSENGKRYRGLRLYDTRRTFIKELREKNPNLKIEELAQVTFHKTLDVLQHHYLEIDGDAIRRKAIANME